jgi:hypothetical protein
MSSAAAKPSEPDDARHGLLGIVYGDVGTTQLKFSVIHPVERNEYVAVNHETCGLVLARVEEVQRRTDLSIERAQGIANGEAIDIEEKVSANIAVIGYRDDRGLLQVPLTPFRAGEQVTRAETDLIAEVIGIKNNKKTGAYVGKLVGHDIPILLDINLMVQKHVSVLAKTGGGKSYITGVLIEELLKHGVTSMIIDPHGEYGSLRDKGKHDRLMDRFGVEPRGYKDQIAEFSPDTKVNAGAKALRFTLSNLDARDILSLANPSQLKQRLPALRRALEVLRASVREFDVGDIIRVLQREDEVQNQPLIDDLLYLQEVDIFAKEGTRIDELVQKGRTSIVNLKGVPPDVQELVVNRIADALFRLRKLNRVPPMMLVVEEAHNYCPQVGSAASSKVLRTIASEGRKFGLGLFVITQRAAKVDKNVLSQCNTQIILKVTNPNDLKAITSSVEGITPGMEEEIQRLPIGQAIVMGAGIQMPLIVEVRARETRHGGESVTVIEE